ncbi:MAG: amino acid ABC transporter ATP-binding protein [Paraclostridium sp.]|uniref:amino acid ABC transporter ATP-binding protein n=1 Tax=Paraclostridium sp. TaxID=2023273 RepID=UPI003F2BA538
MLIVKNLNKSFKNNEIFKNISFTLAKGEVIGIVGKSGAGKTTLLRCISGLENFDKGEIIVDNKVFKNSKDILNLKGDIGMVFQSFNLFPHMTVLENIITAPVNVLNQSKENATKDALNILKRFGLEDKINAYPCELSGGQKQRVSIARSFALSPKILCFDEPTSALDPNSINDVVNIINTLKQQGVSILIITHDFNFAKKVSDKIMNIKNGFIEITNI